MFRPYLLLSVACAIAVPLSAQEEVLHYKFDAGGGTRVLNFASGGPAPREGDIVSNLPAAAWFVGRFGLGFAGLAQTSPNYNRVESGWAPQVNGGFSYALFLRYSGGVPQTGTSDLLGVPVAGGFRAYTDGSSLITTGIDGSATTFATNSDIWQMANVGWVHVAFVVDDNRSSATYYVNGAVDARLPISGGARISAPDFWVGQHLPSLRGSVYEIDEVRVLARAATPNEVQAWAQDSAATDVEFGVGCGGRMVSQNGPPSLGNGSYAIAVGSLPNGFGVLALGTTRFTLGGVPLPFDLGLVLPSLRGCLWHTSSDLMFPLSLDGQGGGAFGLGIPNVLGLRYRPVYAQGLFTDLSTEQSTNALALSIGT